eukprot:TRINITY_DN464_c1_g1_i1.p2 TRINITY_DN464_c1_g1~~TRINITY_DN464_c1_g1_i1.p2  ORF type:complete len:155 (-),score=42.55 TRINITY_DN464_c1_g1_i1:1583-2047(-)
MVLRFVRQVRLVWRVLWGNDTSIREHTARLQEQRAQVAAQNAILQKTVERQALQQMRAAVAQLEAMKNDLLAAEKAAHALAERVGSMAEQQLKAELAVEERKLLGKLLESEALKEEFENVRVPLPHWTAALSGEGEAAALGGVSKEGASKAKAA